MSCPLLVEVEGLSRRFDLSRPWLGRIVGRAGRRHIDAVRDVSFTIATGETVAIVGESGSGKSTLGRMAVGLLPPTAGAVRIAGIDLARERDARARRRLRRRIQMIFQDPYASIDPRWRVEDIIAEPLLAFGLIGSKAEALEEVRGLLARVGLDPRHARDYPHQFSGGQRQRICIARALAARPQFIVCDEPTSSLDVSVQAQILNLMRDLQDELGLTYLLISHNLAVVRHMASRIGVLYLGRLVELAPARDLFRRPQHPYTRMLLDAVPNLAAPGRRHQVAGEVANPLDPPAGCAFHPRCPAANERCHTERPRLTVTGATLVACHAVAEGRI